MKSCLDAIRGNLPRDLKIRQKLLVPGNLSTSKVQKIDRKVLRGHERKLSDKFQASSANRPKQDLC